jgi:putative ABC transport system permease protein
MSLLAAIRKLWRSIAPRAHSDVEEEFRSALDAYRDDLTRQGLTTEEAHRKARIDLGQAATQNETYRDAVGLRLFDELGGDMRYGLRALRRNPSFATVAVLTRARDRRYHSDVLAHLRCAPASLPIRRRRPHHEPSCH